LSGWILLSLAKTDIAIEPCSRRQRAYRPKEYGLVSAVIAERDCFSKQISTKPPTSRRRINEEPTQLCFPVRDANDGDASHDFAFTLDDPKAIPACWQADEGRQRLGDIRLKRGIEPLFGGIGRTVKVDDVPQVAGLQIMSDREAHR
jgi:hypothetical protein